ncbi:72 kDa type IV collagenase-like [Sabethes cyaneus]|uniref:72 kDa type IV collagenase-like n=1 Tax=Sabethes cyaneus TaxID=53552 RepID=UPI00237EAB68|nr:72 kDa type IV collagenase-like [Sabethes cyaneus]
MNSCRLFLLAVCIACGVQSAPSAVSSRTRSQSSNSVDPTEALEIPNVTEQDAEIMLRGLGYNEIEDVDGSEINTRMSDSTERSLADLIRIFQQQHGLEETGILDDETKLVIASPRCGSKKSAKTKDGVMKWTKQRLTYRIHNYPRGKTAKPIRNSLARAFSEWSKVTNLDFEEVSDAGADIEVRFGGTFHNQRGDQCIFEDPNTLAHAFYPEIGDVHFNSKYFFEGDATMEDFLDTALHEIGHSLGLEHSSSKASLMHPTESNGFTEPQPMDVQKIQSMYGVRRGGRTINTSGPKLCSLSKIDAAIDDEDGNIFVLAGNYYYNANQSRSTGQLISTKWPGLPGNIDAAFRYTDGRSYFFKGDKYWRFKGSRLDVGHPRLIRKGFPGLPNDVDALMVDGDGDIYAFRGSQYWTYDPKARKVSSNTPNSIKVLGLPSNVDAAVDTETTIAAFKGISLYKANDSGKFKMTRSDMLMC